MAADEITLEWKPGLSGGFDGYHGSKWVAQVWRAASSVFDYNYRIISASSKTGWGRITTCISKDGAMRRARAAYQVYHDAI